MFWSFKKSSKNKITSLKWVAFTASWEFNIPKDDMDNLTSQKQGKTVFVSSSDWKIINHSFEEVLPFQDNIVSSSEKRQWFEKALPFQGVAFKKKDWTVWQILEDGTILYEGQDRYSI
jgi:hypothetical protein